MYVAAYSAQRELPRRVIAAGRLGDLRRGEPRLRVLYDVEKVRSAERVIAFLVAGVERGHVDRDFEFARREIVRREVERRGEFFERALVLGAGLDERVFQRALCRILDVSARGRGGECRGGGDESRQQRGAQRPGRANGHECLILSVFW